MGVLTRPGATMEKPFEILDSSDKTNEENIGVKQ
jgi:hypothetical protein